MDDNHFFLQGRDDSPLVAALHLDLVERGTCLSVHACDEMFNVFYYGRGESRDLALHMYLDSGKHIWKALRRVLESHFRQLGEIESLLDFAAGYGRVTRHIATDLQPDRIWISEIDPGAVEFQENTFGVQGLRSTAEPEAFHPGRDFSCVLVSSLFTHLPEARFLPWIERLLSLVREGGLLAFSVHDMALAPAPGVGFLFHPSSESGSLSNEEYGSTWVSEEYVRGCLAALDLGRLQVSRIPRGLASFQDLYVVSKGSGSSSTPLESLRGGVDGFVEECRLNTLRRLLLQGWMIDRYTKSAVREVRFYIDGDLVGSTDALFDRPEVAINYPGDAGVGQGWQAELALPEKCDLSATTLRIAALGSDGFVSTLAEGSIVSFLARVALYRSLVCERDNAALRESIQREQEQFAQRLAEETRERELLRKEIHQLEVRIAAMQASRFWKLRDRWFSLKRRLHLTTEL